MPFFRAVCDFFCPTPLVSKEALAPLFALFAASPELAPAYWGQSDERDPYDPEAIAAFVDTVAATPGDFARPNVRRAQEPSVATMPILPRATVDELALGFDLAARVAEAIGADFCAVMPIARPDGKSLLPRSTVAAEYVEKGIPAAYARSVLSPRLVALFGGLAALSSGGGVVTPQAGGGAIVDALPQPWAETESTLVPACTALTEAWRRRGLAVERLSHGGARSAARWQPPRA
jgi:hypothetical protein